MNKEEPQRAGLARNRTRVKNIVIWTAIVVLAILTAVVARWAGRQAGVETIWGSEDRIAP